MKNIITILLLAILSCNGTKKIANNSDLIGTWCLQGNQINYPTLTFRKNSIAEFGSRMDTVYSFKYMIDVDYLNLVLPDSSVSKNRIITLTKSKLHKAKASTKHG